MGLRDVLVARDRRRPVGERELELVVATYVARCHGHDKRRVVTNHDARLQWAGAQHGIRFARLMRHEARLREMIAASLGWDAAVFSENLGIVQTVPARRRGDARGRPSA